jgi:hypothetical protein
MSYKLNECGHLWQIIRDKKRVKAPKKTTRTGDWYEFLVAIGDDNTASILMTKDDYEVLYGIDKAD